MCYLLVVFDFIKGSSVNVPTIMHPVPQIIRLIWGLYISDNFPSIRAPKGPIPTRVVFMTIILGTSFSHGNIS